MAFVLDNGRNDRYTYYGNVTTDGSRILIYGNTPGVETRRTLLDLNGRSTKTIRAMLRGLLGIPGERLLPFNTVGRTCVRITNWHHQGSPYRRNFVNACRSLAEEAATLPSLPEWYVEACNTELPTDIKS